MSDPDTIDEPAPTVVGPQPSSREGVRKIAVPRGLEKLVALAGLSPEWREKVLTDPIAAAVDAELELSDTERAVAASVPRAALEQMIDSFGKKLPRPKGIKRVAAGAAATALTGCGEPEPPAPTGSRPDVPPSRPEEPAPPATKGMRSDVPPMSAEKAEEEPPPPAAQGMRADEPDK